MTSNWFVAWGTWAGGLGTAAAFLIAAFSILVASAHSRFDRRQDAEIREDDLMGQARLLSIYKVDDKGWLSTLPTYRIDNWSKDWFFDVTVPYVDARNAEGHIERRTADLAEKEIRYAEHIPSGEQLTPHRDNSDDEAWFTLVRVHATNAKSIDFAVEYTDASGRRWRQSLGGKIERIPMTKAVPIRRPDRFQPRPPIKKLSGVEAWRSGITQGGITDGLPPLESDEDFLEVIGVSNVQRWKRIERIDEIKFERGGELSSDLEVSVTFGPAAPPFWLIHFRNKLAESGLRYGGGRSYYVQTDRFLCSRDIDTAGLNEVIDAAIQFANDRFEENELAAARRALESRRNRTRSDN
ncbi:hypothetical protein AIIKEEIJ_01227 [Rhodococcus sp. YH1]|nr:hypothetical protein [Rhodococcus sp. YH1]